MQIVNINIDTIKEYENNTKIHTDEQIEQIMTSIERYGNNDPIAIDENNVIIEGHGRYLALKRLGVEEVPVIKLEHLTEEQKREYILVHNKLTMNTGFDMQKLQAELETIEFDMSNFDFDIFKDDSWETEKVSENINESNVMQEKYPDGKSGSLVEDFIVPPVNIFDTRIGYWVERKRKWRELIKDNGESRNHVNLINNITGSFEEVSLLDPVLSEIVVKWFSPKQQGNKIFDCFAGDTIFGFVSSYLKNEFTGIELREEQAALNQARCNDFNLNAKYICDDGRNIDKHLEENSQDLLFSCPPYFDLEVYSDKENDASNQSSYEEFYAILDDAFKKSVKLLKDDRFAVIVVGDVRDKKTGAYYGFVDDVKKTMKEAGLHFYNDIVLINSYGTAGLRARGCFKTRKTVNVKQNVLVFYKGNPKNIKDTFEDVEVIEIES